MRRCSYIWRARIIWNLLLGLGAGYSSPTFGGVNPPNIGRSTYKDGTPSLINCAQLGRL
ncbi:MAG TPA: hypothetical protein VFA33_06455 [Bryobacteraceae bacterium]|nr:hypothetical protein [Bryobacteraceae bacterium]